MNGILPGYNEKRIQVSGNGMITKLLLEYLGMRGKLPDLIGNLSSLTALDALNNDLTHIPDTIGNLSSLTRLDVHNNPITSTRAGKDEVRRRFGRVGLDLHV